MRMPGDYVARSGGDGGFGGRGDSRGGSARTGRRDAGHRGQSGAATEAARSGAGAVGEFFLVSDGARDACALRGTPEAGVMKPQVLMLTPEPPYPLQGGGAYRIAS